MHARGRGGRGMHVPRAFKSGVSLGSKRLPLVPLGACARRCRFRSHCAPSTQASVVASASSAASGRPETAISVSLLARSVCNVWVYYLITPLSDRLEPPSSRYPVTPSISIYMQMSQFYLPPFTILSTSYILSSHVLVVHTISIAFVNSFTTSSPLSSSPFSSCC